ncbi:hypothetical protein LA080_012921 [Diaporthe eres]|nr:hypothetical protein LA080_012921 [Diaporthe eres]
MRSFIIISALYFSYVSAQAQCFDAGDCILSGGGQCNKAAGQLLGTCQKDGAPATGGQTAAPSASAAPQGLDALLGGLLGSGAPKQPSSAPPAATTKRP